MENNFIPTIIEKTSKGEHYNFDIYSKFLRDKIIFLNGNINIESSNLIITQMLYLESENCKNIFFYINSNGGDIYSGMAIYDTMKYIKSKITTICVGCASSMAAFLLSSGEKGCRYGLSNSRIMIHQPLGSAHGQASDIKIQAKEILFLKKKLNILLSHNTKKELKKIKKNTNRDFFMSPDIAVKYGIIDWVLLNK